MRRGARSGAVGGGAVRADWPKSTAATQTASDGQPGEDHGDHVGRMTHAAGGGRERPAERLRRRGGAVVRAAGRARRRRRSPARSARCRAYQARPTTAAPTPIAAPVTTGRRRRGERGAHAHRAGELQDRPAVLERGLAQPPVRVDRGGVPDRRQHRQVGDRVAVGVAVGEVVAALARRPGAWPRPCSRRRRRSRSRRCSGRRRSPSGWRRPGRRRASRRSARPSPRRCSRRSRSPGRRRGAPRSGPRPRRRSAGRRSRAGSRGRCRAPSRTSQPVHHRRQLRPQPLHLLGVGAGEGEDELRVGGLRTARRLISPPWKNGRPKARRAGLGDDRLVQVEERRCAGHKSRL